MFHHLAFRLYDDYTDGKLDKNFFFVSSLLEIESMLLRNQDSANKRIMPNKRLLFPALHHH